MRFAKFFSRRDRTAASSPEALLAIAGAVQPVIEALEMRRLLSTVTIPLAAHSVDLRPGGKGQGDILVYADTQVDSIGEFTDPYGTDIIDCRGESVTCYDLVPAVIKPQSSVGGSIGFVNGGTGSTLQLNAGYYDRKISVSSSTSAGTTVLTSDENDSAAGTDSYDSTFSHLTIRANDAAVGSDPATGTAIDVPSFHGDGTLTVDTGASTWDTIRLGGGSGDPVTDAKVIMGSGNDNLVILSTTQTWELPGRTAPPAPSGGSVLQTPIPSVSAAIDFGSGEEKGHY